MDRARLRPRRRGPRGGVRAAGGDPPRLPCRGRARAGRRRAPAPPREAACGLLPGPAAADPLRPLPVGVPGQVAGGARATSPAWWTRAPPRPRRSSPPSPRTCRPSASTARWSRTAGRRRRCWSPTASTSSTTAPCSAWTATRTAIGETVKNMLRRNPQLTVFALHDASPDGCLLPLVAARARVVPGAHRPRRGPGAPPGDRAAPAPPGAARAGPRAPAAPGRDPPAGGRGVAPRRQHRGAGLPPPRAGAARRLRRHPARGPPGRPGVGLRIGHGRTAYYGPGGIIWVGDVHDERRDTASVDGFG